MTELRWTEPTSSVDGKRMSAILCAPRPFLALASDQHFGKYLTNRIADCNYDAYERGKFLMIVHTDGYYCRKQTRIQSSNKQRVARTESTVTTSWDFCYLESSLIHRFLIYQQWFVNLGIKNNSIILFSPIQLCHYILYYYSQYKWSIPDDFLIRYIRYLHRLKLTGLNFEQPTEMTSVVA